MPDTVFDSALAAALDAALPQTQCTRCGYPDCQGYAEAIATGEAGINQCPPGGAEGIERLARLTGRAVTALNPANGIEGPRHVAWIDENWCIGCTLCLKACPVDCIVGASKRMHTVIEPQCTGCELCLPVCPVDCIVLEPVSGARSGWSAWSASQADEARARYAWHRERGLRDAAENEQRRLTTAETRLAEFDAAPGGGDEAQVRKRAMIEAVVAKARARLQDNKA